MNGNPDIVQILFSSTVTISVLFSFLCNQRFQNCRFKLTFAILPNKVAGEDRLRCEAALGLLLALSVLCRRNNRVEVVESQNARSLMLSWLFSNTVWNKELYTELIR